MFSCILPWPPSVNTYYTIARGRKILSKKGRQFKADCGWCIVPFKPVMMTGDLEVLVEVTPPDKRKRDLDNLLKPILDALGDYCVYEDDSQIVDLRIKKIEGVKGEVLITIKELEHAS